MTAFDESEIRKTLERSFASATHFDEPYYHWVLDRFFPDAVAEDLQQVEFPVADLGGVSGKRELHNDTRHYVDKANRSRLASFEAIANSFQSADTARAIEGFTGAKLDGTYLRIEYAQDVSGFWLEPHTDLGVKRLTILIYLSNGENHDDLGTDIYDNEKQWFKRAPFAHNGAMMFVPGDNTYHGFENRSIKGVRKSLILNYVTEEWRDREQLAFPTDPLRIS